MQKFCNILLSLLVMGNMVYFYFFPFNTNPPDYVFTVGKCTTYKGCAYKQKAAD